jgi:chemotaxis protein methyltransferase CheR
MLPADFETFSRLVKSESGLAMTPDKAYLFESRLRPIAHKWNLAGIEQLAEALRNQRNMAQIRDVAEAMTVNESFFFRDTKPFDQLRNCLLPTLLAARAGGRRRLRIWSAAASSGQEAYSIAMLLHEHGVVSDGWAVEIVGTDLSTEILERAKAGVYTSFEVQRGLPARLLAKYFTRDGDRWRVADAIRQFVRFTRYNLLHDLTPLGVFDIVFCRNVLIYFDLATKSKALAAIRQQMPEDGYLLLGAAETVLGVSDNFTSPPGLSGIFVPSKPKPAAVPAHAPMRLGQETTKPQFQYGSLRS